MSITKTVPALMVVGARETVPSTELMRERCMALHDLTCDFIGSTGSSRDRAIVRPVLPSDEGIDVEKAYPVNVPERHSPRRTGGTARLHEPPGTTVTYGADAGSYDDFGAVGRMHVAVKEW